MNRLKSTTITNPATFERIMEQKEFSSQEYLRIEHHAQRLAPGNSPEDKVRRAELIGTAVSKVTGIRTTVREFLDEGRQVDPVSVFAQYEDACTIEPTDITQTIRNFRVIMRNLVTYTEPFGSLESYKPQRDELDRIMLGIGVLNPGTQLEVIMATPHSEDHISAPGTASMDEMFAISRPRTAA